MLSHQSRFTYTSRFYMPRLSQGLSVQVLNCTSNNDNTVAALVPSTGSLVVVINGTGSSIDYTFDLSKFSNWRDSKDSRFSLPGSDLLA